MIVKSHPSLALIKYWGKQNAKNNTPATSSLAINLKSLTTTSTIELSNQDQISINDQLIPLKRYTSFFKFLRKKLSTNQHFRVESRSNFPTNAGLASSSSGFAALALGCARLINAQISKEIISEIACLGSASAARSIFDGFTILKKGSRIAEPLYPPSHWKELRVVIAIVSPDQKSICSREAMTRSKKTSPFFASWVANSEKLFSKACFACLKKDLQSLGSLMQESYLQMFATQFSASPPIFYWEPESIQLIKTIEKMRKQGLNIWETMDAGPQVKIVCEEESLFSLLQDLKKKFPNITFITSEVGPGAQIIS